MSTKDSSSPKKRANGEGSVFQRKDGRWGVVVYRWEDGRKIRKHYYYRTEAAALRGHEARTREAKQHEDFLTTNAAAKPKERRTYSFAFLDPSPGVYFIQPAHKGSPIKIGVAKNLRRRLMDLQAACPYQLCILHILHGAGRTEEVALHAQFAHLRLHGEWFTDEGSIKRYLADL